MTRKALQIKKNTKGWLQFAKKFAFPKVLSLKVTRLRFSGWCRLPSDFCTGEWLRFPVYSEAFPEAFMSQLSSPSCAQQTRSFQCWLEAVTPAAVDTNDLNKVLHVWSFTSLKPRKGSIIFTEPNTTKELKDKGAAELSLSVWTCQSIMISKTQTI